MEILKIDKKDVIKIRDEEYQVDLKLTPTPVILKTLKEDGGWLNQIICHDVVDEDTTVVGDIAESKTKSVVNILIKGKLENVIAFLTDSSLLDDYTSKYECNTNIIYNSIISNVTGVAFYNILSKVEISRIDDVRIHKTTKHGLECLELIVNDEIAHTTFLNDSKRVNMSLLEFKLTKEIYRNLLMNETALGDAYTKTEIDDLIEENLDTTKPLLTKRLEGTGGMDSIRSRVNMLRKGYIDTQRGDSNNII